MSEALNVDAEHLSELPAATVQDQSPPVALAVPVDTDDDAEAQKPDITNMSSTSSSEFDDLAGKGPGIAMFIIIVVGFVFGWSSGAGPWISFGILIAGIVLSSIITCGCCCAGSDPNLNPKVKRWATATLLCLILQFSMIVTTIIILPRAYIDIDIVTYTTISYVLLITSQILYIPGAVFAGIFTWARDWGCNV